MKLIWRTMVVTILLSFFVTHAWAVKYPETKKMFADAGIETMFNSAYGYALFPTIGKAGFVVGGAYGEGRVYEQRKYIGNVVMTQATVGFQISGFGFSQVVFSRTNVLFLSSPMAILSLVPR